MRATNTSQPSEDEGTGGVRLTAQGLNKWVRPDLNILQDISLHINENEFVVIVGQSGGGKSTLLDALCGYRPATHGQVTANGVNVSQNYDAIRTLTGYVPQRDIIHMELTVYQALDYAARLRLPRGTSKAARHTRVMEVLEALDLTHRKDVQVSGLSGGQQKRVSIGVELLTRPRLFFLDEPTSGLDPGTETALMLLMRRLADQGRTIVLITHATKNVMLADKVVFLARGGYLAWYGPPGEALAYFDVHRNQAERATGAMQFDDIYAILEDSSRGSAQEWAERYRKSEAYARYVAEPIERSREELQAKPSLRERLLQARDNFVEYIGPFQQFLVLSARNLRILTRDRSSLILMLLAPLLVGGLDLLIAPMMGRQVYDFYAGAPVGATQSLFLLTLYTLMVASLSQMREIVKEADIYKRERMVNLRVFPYVGSKVWVAVILALYHAAAYTAIRYWAFEMPGGETEFWMIYITIFLAVLAGMMLGLLASALAPNPASAPMITLLFILPNLVLSGAIVNLPPAASVPSSSHWAFKALVGITGIGADIAADDCWKFPPDLVQAMNAEDKLTLSCRCMGSNAFDPHSCNFPGTGGFYTPELDEDAPQKPDDLGEPPSEPELPPPPAEPADAYDKVSVATYLNDLQTYQVEVARRQNDFKMQVEDYRTLSSLYQTQMVAYQGELSSYYVARSAAIGAAEGNIRAINERFGWAFVSKDDPVAFRQAIVATWQAQGGIIAISIAVVLLAMRIKDRKR